MKIARLVSFLMIAALLAVSPVALMGANDKGATWTEDFRAAVAASKKTGKPILIDFTGSDWCGYCKIQKKEVFSTKQWQEWAAENVILFTADYPRKPQDAAVKAQNEQLRDLYQPRGFPTVVFIDGKGTELGRWAGYGPGTGPEQWIERATPIIAKACEEKSK